jgi:hypothetical protein
VGPRGQSAPWGARSGLSRCAVVFVWIRLPRTSRRRSCRTAAGGSASSQHSDGWGADKPRPRWGRWRSQGRPGARCPPFNEPVSPDRPPNPACQSSRHRALHEARYQTNNGCVAARLRSTRPGLSPTPVFTCGSCPADTPPPPRCAPSPRARLSRARTTTGTPPRPATNSGRRACPPHQGGKGGYGSLIAVGTALAGGPPHRSQRALLTHWAPALGADAKARVGKGMHHAGGRQPSGREAVHPCPSDPRALAAALKRLMPDPGHLGPEGRNRARLPGTA